MGWRGSNNLYPDGGDEECEVRIAYLPDEAPANAVAEALAQFKGREVMNLQPIHHDIDADALNKIMTSAMENGGEVTVKATIHGCIVTIRSDGIILVQEPGSSADKQASN